ncbi:MAG: hypothetical protein LBE62_02215 [Azonexus sp.]|jgi:hypothetical protein|nr:hypothetical protein [Azonexus sp.]
MAVINDFAENKLVDALLRGQTINAPATYYMALSTATRSDAGGPTEPTDPAYARAAVTPAVTSFSSTQGDTTVSSGTDGTVENLTDIAWPTSTAAWGEIKSVWFMDAATGGNAWISIDLTTPINVATTGFTLHFAPGALTFQIDN